MPESTGILTVPKATSLQRLAMPLVVFATECRECPLPLVAVHNPLAHNPLLPGLLGVTTEYVARQVGNEFCIERYSGV
jgi:hypothetical protein